MMGVLARELIDELQAHTDAGAAVLALSGHLGAGKTSLVQAIARELGIEEKVGSPTFVLMKSYDTSHLFFKKLVHIDAYRVSEKEIGHLKLQGIFSRPHTLVCIEWAERLPSLLPSSALRLSLEAKEPQSRFVKKI